MRRSHIMMQLVQLLVLVKSSNLGYAETAEQIIRLFEIRGILPPQPVGTNFKPKWEDESKPSGSNPPEDML